MYEKIWRSMVSRVVVLVKFKNGVAIYDSLCRMNVIWRRMSSWEYFTINMNACMREMMHGGVDSCEFSWEIFETGT